MASNGTPDFSSFQAGAMYGFLKKDGQPDEIPEVSIYRCFRMLLTIVQFIEGCQ